MSFSKAPIKRFNEEVSNTPAPGTYEPKSLEGKKGGALSMSKRFQDLKLNTPGPGQYHPLMTSTAHKKLVVPPLNQSGSSEVFCTPNWKGVGPRKSKPASLVKCPIFKGSTTSSTGSLLGSSLDDSYWKEKCAKLEKIIMELDSQVNRKSSERDLTQKLQQELEEQKMALSSKLDDLLRAEDQKRELELKWQTYQEKKEANASKICSLEKELNLLIQDNKTLEENAEKDRKRLEDERKGLEEKATFLHFTQEQLHTQLQIKDDLVKQLQLETDSLKEQVTSLNQCLVEEKRKISEIMDTYAKDNADTLEEFERLNSEKEALLKEKCSLMWKSTLDKENSEKLQDEIIALVGSKNELGLKLEEAKGALAEAQNEIHQLNLDMEVINNDQEVLKEEMIRLEKNKVVLELDLAEVAAEKLNLEAKLVTAEHEHNEVMSQLNELKQNHEESLQLIKGLETQTSDLKSEMGEIEMKNSSLQGSLSATESYLGNLVAENETLNENLKQTHENYKKKCQTLEEQVEELKTMKDDLNKTCVILEQRMKNSEQKVVELTLELTVKDEKLEEAQMVTAKQVECHVLQQSEISNSLKLAREEIETKTMELNSLNSVVQAKDEKIKSLKEDIDSFNKIVDQKTEMEQLLEEFMGQSCSLEERVASLETDKEEKMKTIDQLKSQLETNDYKALYEDLKAQIEPFKQQLGLYESEKMTLIEQNKATASSLKDLAEQHGKLLGHQNHRQKINHLVKLKQENVSLLQEKVNLQSRLKMQNKKISELESKLKGGKENQGNMSLKPTESSKRQTTIMPSSPLAERNRKSKN